MLAAGGGLSSTFYTSVTPVPRIITDETPAKVVDEQQVKLFGSPKERLDFYRREIHYETTNLSNRTNAYLSAQSFLVIAYASSMANMNTAWGAMFTLVVPPMLALLGLLSTLFAWPGIRAACDIIQHWHHKQAQLLLSEPVIGLTYDDSPLFSDWESSETGPKKSLLFSKRSPWLFSFFWIFLGSFAVFVQLVAD
ncbi:hypothetical protein ALQ91_04336 [Pseudomonas syringae pv. syringae]|nr:hypothetical protein ALQ91_04336 [Pseudomonas syringae pv. syringae]